MNCKLKDYVEQMYKCVQCGYGMSSDFYLTDFNWDGIKLIDMKELVCENCGETYTSIPCAILLENEIINLNLHKAKNIQMKFDYVNKTWKVFNLH